MDAPRRAREHTVRVRANDAERAEIVVRAERAGLSVQDYALASMTGKRLVERRSAPTAMNESVLAELTAAHADLRRAWGEAGRQGGLVKHLCETTPIKATRDAEMADALREWTDAALALQAASSAVEAAAKSVVALLEDGEPAA